ncbi:hypothetical protein [Rhizobium sp. BK176]|uniref:hypothetical protein n=1 Tax=Rhizobium sp. BK176 TaxID=2587071 RepID=UPI0021674EFC|nr:hypothetical protein [Rhizobium sp. BK176]MCS4088463.1 hypothetical protein [Rhizobium sp. BK176]
MASSAADKDLGAVVKTIASRFSALGATFDDDEKIMWAFGHNRLLNLWRRDLVTFTQRTKEASPVIQAGSPLDDMRQAIESHFESLEPGMEITDGIRALYSRLETELVSKCAELPALSIPSAEIYSAFTQRDDTDEALQQLQREHIALALRPTIVELLSRWLSGRLATTVVDCFLGLPDKVNYDEGILSLWDDGSKPDDQRFDIGYVTKRQMLGSWFVDENSPEYAREVYLRNNSLAILLMFEWDVSTPWKMFQKERHLVSFDQVKAASDEARLEFNTRREAAVA